MTLQHFSWACLVIGVLPVAYQVVMGPDQDLAAASFFSSTMIVMAVGFGLVRREIAKLRSEDP